MRKNKWSSRLGKLGMVIGCALWAVLTFPGVTFASQYTGTVLDIRTAPSPTTAGNVRVSIEISGTTSCTGAGGYWYSYDLPSGPTAQLWGAILLAALSDGRNVGISGTGTCDAYGLEEVSYIDGL